MTPEERAEFNKVVGDLNNTITQLSDLQDSYNTLSDLYYRDNFIDKYVFQKDVSITPKFGFGGATPVARQPAIPTPTGGTTVDTEGRVAIDLIRQVLIKFGFTL